ncbi:MAG: hypothetical protein KF681_06495 [Bdellovibrionaceae bacterium]|nr:hypothetical protein [Pseudobdellovibrionaceae bacterium]
MPGKLGRIFLTAGLALLVALFTWEVFAAEGDVRIIEVRRNIPLADTDPVYKDFYINAGGEAGLKPNLVVSAVRKVNVKDATGTQAFGELLIPVGQLKVIFVQHGIAVAREHKPYGRELYPMLEQTGIMGGDLIDLKGSFVDNSPPPVHKIVQKETATSETGEREPGSEAPPTASLNPAVIQRSVMDSMAEAMGKVADHKE